MEQVYTTQTARAGVTTPEKPRHAVFRRPRSEHVTAIAAHPAGWRRKSGRSRRTTERLGPDHEDLGAGWGRVPGLAHGAASVAGRPRGGGGRQLRPQAL